MISFFLVRKNYRENLTQENSRYVNEMDSLVGNLDAQLEQMISLGTYVCINEEILTILRSGEALNDPTIWYKDAPMKIIQDMMALSGQIKTIAIYPENGTLPFLRCMDNSAYIESIDEIRESEIYATACSRIGKYILRRAEKSDDNIYVNNRSNKIVASREIYDISRRYKLGYLTIGMSVMDFDGACARLLRKDDEAVYIFTADGDLLSANGIFDEKEVHTRISEAGGGLVDNNICESAGYYIYKSVSDKTGLVAYRFVSASMRNEILRSVLFTNMSLLIGILLSLMPIAYIISYIITRPLKKLSQAMVEFQEGNFDRKLEVESGDEIGMVSDGFNTMVRAIKDLIDSNYVIRLKEKESELDALQAQINPHFLYNALDTFYWKCVEAGNDEIGEDILALSNLFRLVLSRGEGMIRISDEISLISNYLHIQHERFGNRLSYKIDVEDDIIEERIPKLILQPFVENAVLHGFEKGDEDFSLLIRGRRDDKRLVFVISDSGVGMTKEKIDELLHGAGSAKKEGRISGYAIWNVRERLDLLYHGDYKLKITSGVGEGTEVILELGKIYFSEGSKPQS
ncbi:sensor histidine kinase [Butyrivibrio sp. MC2013]|uniref:sensor histidine kinase n=1 Tax=Butyrivibrio sp. MC2013 TaxID=1280686 RepID=UPI00041560C7|nr:sensor histidine kinase [Butyrivibrio sp. MC2013]